MSLEGRNQGLVCTSTADCYLRHCKTCFKLMEFPVLKEQSETWKEEELQRVQVEMCYKQLNCSQKFITFERQYKKSSSVELLFVFSSPDVYFYPSQKRVKITTIRLHHSVDFRMKFETLNHIIFWHSLSFVIFSLAPVATSVKTLLSKCLAQMSVGVSSQAKP